MTTLHRQIGTAACRDNHQMAEQPGPADLGDAIWNRAALHGGGSRPRYGDVALSAVLRLHSLVMSGGLLDAVERLADPELDAAENGYAWLGHPDAARLIAYVREQVHEADQRYADIIPADASLYIAFGRRLAADPSAFASTGDRE
jgi:fructose-specific component phosphotransferase system IIB-like protein